MIEYHIFRNGRMAAYIPCQQITSNRILPPRNPGWGKYSPLSPPSNDCVSVTSLLINLLLHLGAESNGAHDAIAKLLVQDGLVGIAVVLDDLVQAVDERLGGGHGPGVAAVRKGQQLGRQGLLGQVQQGGELLDVLGGGAGLAVEDGRHGDLAAAEELGNLGEGEVGLGLGLEELSTQVSLAIGVRIGVRVSPPPTGCPVQLTLAGSFRASWHHLQGIANVPSSDLLFARTQEGRQRSSSVLISQLSHDF